MRHNFYIGNFGIFEGRGFNATAEKSETSLFPEAQYFSIGFLGCSGTKAFNEAIMYVQNEGFKMGVLGNFTEIVFENVECAAK